MITHEIQQTQMKTFHFFNRIKIVNSHTKINKKTLYYTPNCLSSDDDDFDDQNHQQNFQNQRLHSYHVNQPDILNHIHENNICDNLDQITHLKIIIFTQPTQMQKEIPLPYYLQQHEITKNQLTKFSQMPNAQNHYR